MEAITQSRAGVPYPGRRYGSFVKAEVIAPDFLHGTIRVVPHLSGTISFVPHLSGTINVDPHLYGDIRMNQ